MRKPRDLNQEPLQPGEMPVPGDTDTSLLGSNVVGVYGKNGQWGIATPSPPFGCRCHRCLTERKVEYQGMPLAMTQMIVCPICGNKRCPHASDHRLKCTGSNEPGQKGSIYV